MSPGLRETGKHPPGIQAWGVLLLSLAAALPLLGEPSAAAKCTVQAADYQGWKAEEMANSWEKLEIIPQLGGRLMQVTFGGHDYLFVNPQLKGKIVPVDPTQHLSLIHI